MKKIALLILIAVTFSSCQRGCTSFNRDFEVSERDYTLVMFSGGDTVFTDQFRGIVNNSKESDGIYYYKDGVLVEVSGDYVLHSR